MLRLTELEQMEPDVFRRQLRLLLADRSTPEAAALFEVLLRYAHKRVAAVSQRCGNKIPASRQEELVADILLDMMDGGLARFRGGSLPELLGFVRTIADRTTWRSVKAIEREHRALAEGDGELARRWSSKPAAPDELELEVETPLDEKDQEYLISLLRAGSKAELARRSGVSRAAVTQRVQRIVSRVEALNEGERMAHEVWMQRHARIALELEAPDLTDSGH